MRRLPLIAVVVAAGMAVAACGDGDGAADGGPPTIAVTTPLLGDVVAGLTGDLADVEVIMPPGADPHEFQPSARQVVAARDADLVVANGGGFEPGLEDTVTGAGDDGTPVFEALDHVTPLPGDGPDEDVDPHFFTDPARMAEAADALARVLADEVPALDTDEFREHAAGYVAELRALDAEIETTLAGVPPERRKLVTNHDVFAYFADRYGFEVVGAVIPSTTTQAQPSAGGLDELAATVVAEGVPAIFADTSSPAELADALAGEVGGDVEVVELYSESPGPEGSGADTYPGMMRTDAARIAAALAP